MAKLVDAQDRGSCVLTDVSVRIRPGSRIFICMNVKTMLRKALNESQYVDQALDNLGRAKDFNRLPEIDKLALLAPGGDETKLRQLSLINIFKNLGGTFHKHLIRVRILPADEQTIQHKFSLESAGKVGWLNGAVHYDDNQSPYSTVRFDEFEANDQMKGGGTYNELPIMIGNMYPIAIDEDNPVFSRYEQRVDQERQDFKSIFDDD